MKIDGREGENIAAGYLEKKGYKIEKRNYRAVGCEIDIIARKEDTICFIEVKTRSGVDFGFPSEYVNQRKMEKIIRAAEIFYSCKKYQRFKVRFDIISVLYGAGGIKIEYLENAFEADG